MSYPLFLSNFLEAFFQIMNFNSCFPSQREWWQIQNLFDRAYLFLLSFYSKLKHDG